MKKLVFLATTLLMFLAITVNAQQRGPRERMTPEQQATRTVERLTTELKLTDKQQADLKNGIPNRSKSVKKPCRKTGITVKPCVIK